MASNPFTAIDYSKLGKTVSGRSWLEKAIHPPGAAVGAVTGMPDNDSFPSTVTEFRNTFVISPPAATTTTWNALFLVLPSAETPAVKFLWPTGGTVPTIGGTGTAPGANFPGTIMNPNYTFANWDTDVSRARRIYGSATFELDAPSLTDQGMVYCAQTRLETEVASLGQGEGEPAPPANNIIVPALPTDPSTMAQLSPKFYKQRAKEGCFTVSGLVQPVNLYVPGSSTTVNFGSEAMYAASSQICLANRTHTVGGTTVSAQAGVSDNWSSSWVLFTGIDKSATIELKIIHAYELQPELGSSFALFVQQPAEPDNDAVDAYYALRYGMTDGYPASFNFFGGLLAALPSIIPKIASWLLPAAKAVLPMINSAVNGTEVMQAEKPVQVRPVRTGLSSKGGPPMESMMSILRAMESRMANLERPPQARIIETVAAPRRKKKAATAPKKRRAPRRRFI